MIGIRRLGLPTSLRSPTPKKRVQCCLSHKRFPISFVDNAKIISIKIFFVVGILSSLQTAEYHKYKASHFLLKGIREGMLGGLFGGFIGDLAFLPPLFYPIIIFKD